MRSCLISSIFVPYLYLTVIGDGHLRTSALFHIIPEYTRQVQRNILHKLTIEDDNMKQRKKQTEQAMNETDILSREMLNIKEVAFLLRVTERQVRNFIYKGRLKASRVSYHVTIITRTNLMAMLDGSEYNKESPSIFSSQRRPSTGKRAKKDARDFDNVAGDHSFSHGREKKRRGEGAATPPTYPTKTKEKRQLIPSSSYYQSVKDTFVEEGSIKGDTYTLAEICRKYGYTYGRFYNLRMKYDIPCMKGMKTKCFPVEVVDKAMTDERASQGKDLTEHYYTCADIMRLYGLGKTQVRRFAQTHDVRIKKCGHLNYYMKADWEAARKKAEKISTSTKERRE